VVVVGDGGDDVQRGDCDDGGGVRLGRHRSGGDGGVVVAGNGSVGGDAGGGSTMYSDRCLVSR
jgi:hypothetical protein